MKKMILMALAAAWSASAGCALKPDTAVIREGGALWAREGARVTIEGKVAREIWQHMMAPPRGYGHETYFDMGRHQIVIYSREHIDCGGTVRATGTVVKLEGSSEK